MVVAGADMSKDLQLGQWVSTPGGLGSIMGLLKSGYEVMLDTGAPKEFSFSDVTIDTSYAERLISNSPGFYAIYIGEDRLKSRELRQNYLLQVDVDSAGRLSVDLTDIVNRA